MAIALSRVSRLQGTTEFAQSVKITAPRPLRLGVLTPHNPYDRQSFSGTVFHATRALKRQGGLDVRIVGPHQPRGRIRRMLSRASPRFEPNMLAAGGRDFRMLDAILGLVASPLLDTASQSTDVPMIHVTDATPRFLSEVYGHDMPASALDREARVLARTMAVYSSRFMSNRAVAEFGLTGRNVRAVPFGVNFSSLPIGLPQKAPLDDLQVLFVGSDWSRKGGDLAMAAFDRMRASGRKAHLNLVGRVPAKVSAALRGRHDVTVSGLLDKNLPRHQARLSNMFARAHLLVLPTRADCTPMVISEALAHGTPVLATDVGGIREMLGVAAGRVMPLMAGDTAWAAVMDDMTADPAAYSMMSDAAAERASTLLNWDTWAREIARLVAEMVGTDADSVAA